MIENPTTITFSTDLRFRENMDSGHCWVSLRSSQPTNYPTLVRRPDIVFPWRG